MKIKSFKTHQAVSLPSGRSFTLFHQGVEFQEAVLKDGMVVIDSLYFSTHIPLNNICYLTVDKGEKDESVLSPDPSEPKGAQQAKRSGTANARIPSPK